MPRVVIAIALVAAVACGDREVEQLEQVRDAVCACKTSACADDALRRVPQGEVRAGARARAVARAMLDCIAKLHDAERPVDAADD